MENKSRKKIKGVIQMVSLDELKLMREKEAKGYGKYADKISENLQKSKIKTDIKKIRAARLRAKFGLTSGKVEKAGKVMVSVGSGFKKTLFGAGKVIRALGESAEEYHKLEKKRRRKR